MSWSHSSRLGLLIGCFLFAAAIGMASGVSVTDSSVPDSAEVDQEITISYELTDLYAESGNYSLGGQTALENATWTIEQRRGGEAVHTDTFDASTIPYGEVQIDESASDAPDTIVVEITGTVPPVESYSYDDPATFDAARLGQLIDGDASVFKESVVRQYTTGDPGSQGARSALDDARAAIETAREDGADASQAESTFQDGVSAYDAGNFDDAVSLAEKAQSQATSAGSGSDTGTDGGADDSDGGTDDDSTDGTANETDAGSDTETNSSDPGQGDDGSSTDENATGEDADDANASDGSSSDDGGLLTVVLYGLFGLLILAGVGGGAYWYLQREQGPSRDPLG